MLYDLESAQPKLDITTYVAPGAHIIGHVECAVDTSIWFNVVIRGDCDLIKIGPQTNIQDGSVLHTDLGSPLTIGQGVTVGHKAMLHGCVIGDYSLVGINAVVLNGANIGRYCIIGANALVTENMHVPDYSVVMGSPAKIVKTLPEAARAQLEASAAHYVQNAQRFKQHCKALKS